MKHLLLAALLLAPVAARCADTRTLRVFIFAGQSNMVGSDSKVTDIQRYPPLQPFYDEFPQRGALRRRKYLRLHQRGSTREKRSTSASEGR
jgi:hypothetical protein